MKRSETNDFSSTRHEIFKHMLQKIFTRADLKYAYIKAKKGWKVCIGDGGDLVSDCNKSYSPEYKRQFKELFNICLLESDVEYLCYYTKNKEKVKVDFTKEDVINNILEYLSSWGIIMNNPFKVHSEKKLFAKLLYTYIVDLLDVVFYFEEGDGIGKAADHNISDAFEKKIGQLKKKTAKTDISTLIYSVACKNDIEMIFDPDFDRKECNYALCIPVYDRELDIFNRFNLMTDIRYIEKTDANERWYRNDGYYQKNDNVSFTFCDWNKEDSKELYQQPWKYMIKGFDKYPFKRDTMFKPLQLRSNITSFKLLDYDIYNFLLPRYFYYVTKISEEDLKDKYSNIYDNPSMLWHFEEKAIGLLKEKYSFTEKMRFELLLENIMNILEDLVKVDVPSFFNTEIEIKKYISKLPKCFVNVNIFFSYFKKHKAAEKRTIILFIYSISVLIDNLCHNLDDLIMFNAINMTDEKMVLFMVK